MWPSSVTPAGTSTKPDVHNKWDYNTHTHTLNDGGGGSRRERLSSYYWYFCDMCGKREARINWSMATCKMVAPVITETTLRTNGPVSVDSRQ